jgi:hypothetical protein
MAASPNVLVQNGSGSFNSPGDPNYPAGVNVTPGNTISIKLESIASVGQWNLKIVGTDEETTRPSLIGVNPSTGVVSTPSTVVTFDVPSGITGRAYILQSVVNNGGSAYTVTFGIYTLTEGGFRVSAIGERFESDPTFGWARTINQFIKRGGGEGGGVPTNRSVIAGTGILGGGDLTVDRTFTADFGSGVGKVTQGDDSRLSDDRTASGLRTTTTVVSISGVSAPTTGQVLTAIDSTHAQWAAGVSGPPLSNVRFIDGATTVELSKQDGSIGAPYSTTDQAVTAVSSISNPGPTLLITPGNYGSDTIYWLPDPSTPLNIQGLSPDPYATILPLVQILSGDSTIGCVDLGFGIQTTSLVTLKDVIVSGPLVGGAVIAQNSRFQDVIYGDLFDFKNCSFQEEITLFSGSIEGSNSSLTVDTTTNNTLRIRNNRTGDFTIIIVTAGETTTKSQIVDDLNAVILVMGLSAEINNNYQLRIWSSTGWVEVDTAENGSTLNNVISWEYLEDAGAPVYMDSNSYWDFKYGNCVYSGSISLAFPVTPPKYLPLIAGVQSAGLSYTLLGVLPAIDYYNLGFGEPTFMFDAIINIPGDSTAQVRLYDKTNSVALYESDVINGSEVEFSVGDTFTPNVGATILEFWLATPTYIGGYASCISSGITINFV